MDESEPHHVPLNIALEEIPAYIEKNFGQVVSVEDGVYHFAKTAFDGHATMHHLSCMIIKEDENGNDVKVII